MRSSLTIAAARRGPWSRGFSLVETALALGVAAFALIALVGVVPLGLQHFRGAIDATVGAQISQRVMTEAYQTEFEQLRATAEVVTPEFFVLPARYFDEQGNEVAAASINAVYQVRVRGSHPGPADSSQGGTGFTSLPAADDAKRFRPRDSIYLTVQVAQRPASIRLPVNDRLLWPADAAPMSIYTTVISRNGYPAPAKK